MWNLRNTAKPFQERLRGDGRKESCKPILKVEYKTCKNSSEPFVIFSGGLSYDQAGRRPTLTIMHGKAITVLEMDHPIVEFMVLCDTPYINEVQEPYAVVVLLEKDFIVVDLTQSNFPIFENPYPMDIHESPVTCTAYFADCPPDIIPALYSIGAKHKKTGYSHKDWPLSGGTWTVGSQSYPEIIITGHADGTLKFWDATAMTLQMLYKLKTWKVFEKPRGVGEGPRGAELEDDPYAVQMLSWCPHSRLLCVVGISANLILFRFSRHEANTNITVMGISANLILFRFSRHEANTNITVMGISANLILFRFSRHEANTNITVMGISANLILFRFSRHEANTNITVMGISANLILFRFSRHEANTNITALEVRLHCDVEDVTSPSDTENNPCLSEPSGPSHSPQPPPSPRSSTPDSSMACLKVKERVVRMPAGFQADLVVQLQWVDGEPPQPITCLDINSAYGLVALGNCNGLAVVDYLQKTVLLCMSTLELYGPADPFQRLTRSPRRNRQSTSDLCMRGLSNLYSDSKKRIRTSYQNLSAGLGPVCWFGDLSAGLGPVCCPETCLLVWDLSAGPETSLLVWDLSAGPETCLPGPETCLLVWDLSAGLETCLLVWDLSAGSETSLLVWDLSAGPGTCLLVWDLSAGSETCLLVLKPVCWFGDLFAGQETCLLV
ncbi:hypothetical protein ACEWY4_027754 [Coilia grayii]|uniref:Lethal giant larvae homologue 2 domain-containing protein n=1 Tax=Coilia grayii TaxID=363190 RepID=A0ABD1INS0_9TELE